MSLSIYKSALKEEMIVKLRSHVKEWREGAIDAEDAMYDLECWVDEIWGDE
jgi:hypothetical protein